MECWHTRRGLDPLTAILNGLTAVESKLARLEILPRTTVVVLGFLLTRSALRSSFQMANSETSGFTTWDAAFGRVLRSTRQIISQRSGHRTALSWCSIHGERVTWTYIRKLRAEQGTTSCYSKTLLTSTPPVGLQMAGSFSTLGS